MIRTNTVTLSVIQGIAYRQKLPAGGSGIVIYREDTAQPGIASISKTSGEAILTANTSKELFPKEAFAEAIKLTTGLPYRKQGKVQLKAGSQAEEAVEAVPDEPVAEETVVDSAEYQKLIDKYTDKSGKFSYALLNKDLIKFAHSSSIARQMVKDRKRTDTIRKYVVGSKFKMITGNSGLTDAQVGKMADLLDEVSPKGVFREFNDEIRRSLKAAKK
ncbi:MAG: hypothetical protein J5589_07545 [Firmicutes bacterium]|nr:hypothetical protein [Bacillota bacterium]